MRAAPGGPPLLREQGPVQVAHRAPISYSSCPCARCRALPVVRNRQRKCAMQSVPSDSPCRRHSRTSASTCRPLSPKRAGRGSRACSASPPPAPGCSAARVPSRTIPAGRPQAGVPDRSSDCPHVVFPRRRRHFRISGRRIDPDVRVDALHFDDRNGGDARRCLVLIGDPLPVDACSLAVS